MNIINLKDKNLYYIGGVVRDEILRLENFDIDLTYDGDAIEFAKNIPNAKIIQINEPFGTVRIKLNDEEIDIASTRSETYPQKGHLPVVDKIGCSLKEDVLRRDFTVNALAKSTLTGEIIDYTDGLKDIKNKTLRVLHDNSFVDDPTRIVRGLKFALRFNFELDKHTKCLQEKYLNNINYDMSYKRLKKELIETFNLNIAEAFDRFIDQKIYKLISPDDFTQKINSKNLAKLINKHKPKNIWIIYVGLLSNISNLPLTKTEKNIVKEYKKLLDISLNNDYEIYKAFCDIPIESVIMYSTVNPKIVTHYFDDLSIIKPDISGDDLKELGIKPSEEYKKCFDFILEQKLQKPYLTKEDEIILAKKFFKTI